MRYKKTPEEIAKSFFVTKNEIQLLFGLTRDASAHCFSRAQRLDVERLKANYFNYQTVRLKTVLEVLGLTEEELKEKINATSTRQ